MKKKMAVSISILMAVMITACGGQTTSGKDPAAEVKQEAEAKRMHSSGLRSA